MRRRFFYSKLAASNIKKNAQTYGPFILTCICAISMFYMVFSLAYNPQAGETLRIIMNLGVWIIAIFAVIFLFYTNSFLMKRRKKEFGLFNILGMEKKHIGRVIFYETFYVFVISVCVGLALGLLFNKLVFLLLENILRFSIQFEFVILWEGIGFTVALFAAVFVLLLLVSLLQIRLSNPTQLLKGGNVGEKEPKAKWLIALLGLVMVGVAYYIAVTTEDPMQVITLFFLAVILVILGTYLLFTAGSIAILKLLKKNKKYYYKPNHFIAVSGMMYRMKQNAAGLATICVLSTMVLVMVSSTAAMYFGMEDALRQTYPKDVRITSTYQEGDVEVMEDLVNTSLERKGLQSENKTITREINLARGSDADSITDRMLVILPAEDFEKIHPLPEKPQGNQAFVYAVNDPYPEDEVWILDDLSLPARAFTAEQWFADKYIYMAGYQTYYVVVPDMDTMRSIDGALTGADRSLSQDGTSIALEYDFDVVDGEDQQIEGLVEEIFAQLPEGREPHIRNIAEGRQTMLETYGGLFFLGISLGFTFVLATVLIIYYKQVSEGYDDRGRFEIMQKVGLSKREARRAIHSQILTLFFLPLIVAGIHVAFAFPFVTRMLQLMSLTNVTVFAIATGISMAVFAVFYVVVYLLTARVYYKIVE